MAGHNATFRYGTPHSELKLMLSPDFQLNPGVITRRYAAVPHTNGDKI